MLFLLSDVTVRDVRMLKKNTIGTISVLGFRFKLLI